MLWICNDCTTAYSVDAPRCPHCGATDHREQGAPMAKITVHGGPSNLAAEEDPASDVVKAAPAGPSITGAAWGDPTDDGNNVPAPIELSPAVDSPVELSGVDVPLPVAVEGDTGVREAGPVGPVVEYEAPFDYEACTVATLREFLAARELPTTGLKPELVVRLTESDADLAAAKATEES